jgi:hypothetical protein
LGTTRAEDIHFVKRQMTITDAGWVGIIYEPWEKWVEFVTKGTFEAVQAIVMAMSLTMK